MSRTAVLLLAVAALSGCPDNPTAGCPQECERGFACDIATRTCIAAPLPVYERALPGRSVRIAAQSSLVWTVSVDPADGGIIVTEATPGGARDARVLATPTRNERRHVAIAASPRLLVVAWLAASGAYELAWRAVPGNHAMWSFTTIEAPADDGYAGTEDFDVVIRGEQAIALVFRDRNRTARALVADGPGDDWTVELVDDGDTTDDGISCPDQLRRVQPAVGVGFDPDVAARGSQLYAAYYDADCGDLRLAQRGSQRWSVTSVDTGELTADSAERTLVGRWPSIAFDAAGTVAVAYHDVSGGRLMIATEGEGQFETEVVDAGFEIDAFSRERKNLVGAFADLVLSNDGSATIVYFDATSADLQLARREATGADWSRSTLVGTGAIGFSADQVLTDDGRFVVAERLTPAGDGFTSELVFVEAGQ